MRRSHPTGIGGWRNENPRGFRPRGGGINFKPTRLYSLLDAPRFPPPRPYKDHHQYNTRQGQINDLNQSDRHSLDHDKNKFRFDNYQSHPHRIQDRHQKHNYFPGMRHSGPINTYRETPYFHPTNINSMGDVDHRHLFEPNKQELLNHTSVWANIPVDCKQNNYKAKGQNFRCDTNETNKMSSIEYTGHRPPASDHYDGKPGSALDNSNTFSRSVDDTVDIVRKRLLNRNEPSQPTCNDFLIQNHDKDREESVKEIEECNSLQNEQPMKKRIQRQRQNIKVNCDKIKTKIVHQLFKMDKDKIHKLMDNPNSSTKFEYAISSLITESQNSYNQHLRSVAEKSLCSTSTEFIQNDNNTIYEDTFMKQMQCILDPQDTVLLEDMKPMVMAELCKVLQLDNFIPDDPNYQHGKHIQHNYDQYSNEYNVNDHPQVAKHYPDENYGQVENSLSDIVYNEYENPTKSDEVNRHYECVKPIQYDDGEMLFERRPIKKKNSYSEERRISSERRHSRWSFDNKSTEDVFMRKETSAPLFDTSAEQLSEEEDPFAELDKQYHVAVDPNLIESDYPISHMSNSESLTVKNSVRLNIFENEVNKIKVEDTQGKEVNNTSPIMKKDAYATIDNQLINMPESPVLQDFSNKSKNKEKQSSKHPDIVIKHEPTDTLEQNSIQIVTTIELNNATTQENIPECKDINMNSDNTTNTRSVLTLNSRKRNIDQRPSHRKEKRKKLETCIMETNKQILSNNIIDISECTSKSPEKYDTPKSVIDSSLSKDNKQVSKDNKNSDKCVKQKEYPKKQKQSQHKKKHSSDSLNIAEVSPKSVNTTNTNIHTSIKTESKAKLKTIDMFSQQPKKVTVHQTHRNTVLMSSIENKSEDNKPKPLLSSERKSMRRHVATQVIKKYQNKDTQTIQTRKIMRAVQTDPVVFEKMGTKASNPFERMKEIDFEIQLLLQEKFKLYNSMECKDSCPDTMENLGMTVLNLDTTAKDSEPTSLDSFSGDAAADDFTNIPEEELEQIVLETVDDIPITPKLEKRTRRQRLLNEEQNSMTPTTSKRNTRNSKSLNISLIEQIITDDRPLEDIICLDDLETPVAKTNSKIRKQPKKKKGKKKTKHSKSPDFSSYHLKPCSVFLIRENMEKYFQSKPILDEPVLEKCMTTNSTLTTNSVKLEPLEVKQETVKTEKCILEEYNNIDEEVVTEMQFDMLDVSEDIVIGDVYEEKLLEDKDASELLEVPITEEIILDNSQSSAEDGSVIANIHSNTCRTFDYSSDENLRRDSVLVTGNADAVLAVECIDNNFIAACLDGNVYYFNGDGQLLSTFRGSNLAVTCLTIVKEKYGTTVYTGSLDSRIRYYDLETGLEKGPECNVLSPIQTMDRAWDTVFVGTRTGFVLQFECKNNMLIPVSTVKFSDQSILALRAMKEGPRKVLLVAARSENVTIRDAVSGLLLRTLNGPKMTVYTLLYEDGKVYCGTSSHQIHVFDYTSGGHVGTHEGGKGAVCLRAAGGLLYAGCYDGCVYVYREGECRPFAQLRGPSLMLLSLAIVGTKIIAGYKDRSLYIWKIPLNVLQEMIL